MTSLCCRYLIGCQGSPLWLMTRRAVESLCPKSFNRRLINLPPSPNFEPCRVGSVGSVSASRTVGREFASRSGHTKDHHKNGTNCLPAWHAMR